MSKAYLEAIDDGVQALVTRRKRLRELRERLDRISQAIGKAVVNGIYDALEKATKGSSEQKTDGQT